MHRSATSCRRSWWPMAASRCRAACWATGWGAACPHRAGAGLVALDRGRGPGRAPAAGRGAAFRLPAGAPLPVRPVPGRRLPGAGARRRRLDAGDRARLRPGGHLDVQPDGRRAHPVPARLALPGLRELARPVRADRRPGPPVVWGVLALVPRPSRRDAAGQPRRAEADRFRSAGGPGATRSRALVADAGLAERLVVVPDVRLHRLLGQLLHQHAAPVPQRTSAPVVDGRAWLSALPLAAGVVACILGGTASDWAIRRWGIASGAAVTSG